MAERPVSVSGFFDECFRPDLDGDPQRPEKGIAGQLIPDLGAIEPRYVYFNGQRIRIEDEVHPPTNVYPSKP